MVAQQQPHQRKRSKDSLSDEWGTPDELYEELCLKYGINPKVDVCANLENRKCEIFFTEIFNALINSWNIKSYDIWCNPPHRKTKQFVQKAHEQWMEHNINIMMIIPANSMCTKYAEKYIENSAEYHPIFIRPTFLRNGYKSKFNARNGYFVVIFRKK